MLDKNKQIQSRQKLREHYLEKYYKKDLESLMPISLTEELKKERLETKLTDSILKHTEVYNRQNFEKENKNGWQFLKKLSCAGGSAATMLVLSQGFAKIVNPEIEFNPDLIPAIISGFAGWKLAKIFNDNAVFDIKKAVGIKKCEATEYILNKQLDRQKIKLSAIQTVSKQKLIGQMCDGEILIDESNQSLNQVDKAPIDKNKIENINNIDDNQNTDFKDEPENLEDLDSSLDDTRDFDCF